MAPNRLELDVVHLAKDGGIDRALSRSHVELVEWTGLRA